MGRIINPETAGKERKQLSRAIIFAIRELMEQTTRNSSSDDEHTYDLAAFIVLALEEIHQGIDVSVAAWEKRGYWVKADRFRLDWEWSGQLASAMRIAITTNNWLKIT